jgi:hypothetical protein
MPESVPKEMPAQQAAEAPHYPMMKFIIVKTVSVTAVTTVLALLQYWASSSSYKADHPAGFLMGILHGALMPAALPGLLLGHDIPIYAVNNVGRAYNIGYILGINACGTVFFGVSFWRPQGLKWKK